MFNSTEFTTLEVKFTQNDLLEESKKRAIEAYDENNKCLGLIFSEGIQPYEENSDLDDECLPEIPEISKAEEIKDLAAGFNECLARLKNGDIGNAKDLAKTLGIYSDDHPMLSFLVENQSSRKESLKSQQNQLPWTSADSITIFPL